MNSSVSARNLSFSAPHMSFSAPLNKIIPTDSAVILLPVLPIADKIVCYAIGTNGCCRRMLFSLFLAKFFVDVLQMFPNLSLEGM